MSDDEKDEGPGIYRVDTIPPPDGEDDAYSAPTKVGPMADAAVRELMQAAEKRAQELSARVAQKRSANAAAAKAASTMPTPMSVRPTGLPISKPPTPAAAPTPPPPPPTPPSTATPPTPAASPLSASPLSSSPPRPPSVPRPAAIPRVDAIDAPVMPPIVPLGPPPVELSLDGDPDFPPPPRLYDEKDETEDAETLLHKSARPPRQEHTALLPAASSTRPPVASPSPRPREPIPFDRSLAVPAPEEPTPRLLLMPLVVGFLIFAIGLGFYIWSR